MVWHPIKNYQAGKEVVEKKKKVKKKQKATIMRRKLIKTDPEIAQMIELV